MWNNYIFFGAFYNVILVHSADNVPIFLLFTKNMIINSK